jgi:hypothetical protein
MGLLGAENKPQYGSLDEFLRSDDAMALAAGLLANSGGGKSFGEALGAGLLNMQQGPGLDKQFRQMQIQKMQSELQAQKDLQDALGSLGSQGGGGGMPAPMAVPPPPLTIADPAMVAQRGQPAAPETGSSTLTPETKTKLGRAYIAAGHIDKGLKILGIETEQTPLARNLIAAGYQPGTPEFQAAIKQAVLKSGVTVNMGDSSYKVPAGYMMNDPQDPAKGVKPIPGSDADRLTPEQAGKVQMMRSAQNQLPIVEKYLFKKDGTINEENVLNSQQMGPFAGLPFTAGRTLRTAMEQGIQAITRVETGAAMPESEVENTRVRFMPKPLDSNSLKMIKYEMFRDFINGSLKLVDPSGRFNEQRFETELSRRAKERGVDNQPEQTQSGATQTKVFTYDPGTRSLK